MDQTASTKSERKRMGAHYTPPALARLVADRTIKHLEVSGGCQIRVLDPACGDGGLLRAALDALRGRGSDNSYAVGIEADPNALAEARKALRDLPEGMVDLIPGDFLDLVEDFEPQRHLWSSPSTTRGFRGDFDAVIANPPYVRTQVLGAKRAQQLATRFALSGRIDLYHAFIRAIAHVVRPGGVVGIITSNRFMNTLAGKAVRAFLSANLELLEVIDLGDTKLFDAAVLPAVLIGRRCDHNNVTRQYFVPFIRVYSQSDGHSALPATAPGRPSIVEAIAAGDEGVVRVPGGAFAITRGQFSVTAGSSDVWALLSSPQSRMVAHLRNRSQQTIEDVAYVRVGIKTTADDVFIREDWEILPEEKQPEGELLRPLLRHEDARRWAMPRHHSPTARVLYPHVTVGGTKCVVDLDRYPRSREYLTQFRSRLEARRYVIEAGRKWYEVWVPQDPGAWALSKIVVPDISPEPRFFLVDQDYVVNGDCYWITIRPGYSEDLLYLILGVANSSLMSRYHDAVFSNKLYSGRRRYITQYVGKYPLPDESTAVAREIVSLTKELVEVARLDDAVLTRQLEETLDGLVYEAFGLDRHGDLL